MNFKAYLDEVESKLRSFDPKSSGEFAANYIGGKVSKLEFLGLSVPQVRKAYEDGFSFVRESEEKVAEVWNYIWKNSNVFEAMSLSLHWVNDKKKRKDLIKHWPMLKTWADRIDNWAHSDELSNMYAKILETDPKTIYPTLKEWSESVNPWLRRQSTVSLVYYSKLRKKVPPLKTMLHHVQKQLKVDHHYVQKGVGWTLREISNLHPKEALEFLKKNLDEVSATAFTAAIEKLPKKQKDFLKNLRKEKRVKKAKPKSAAKPKAKSPKAAPKKSKTQTKSKTKKK